MGKDERQQPGQNPNELGKENDPRTKVRTIQQVWWEMKTLLIPIEVQVRRGPGDDPRDFDTITVNYEATYSDFYHYCDECCVACSEELFEAAIRGEVCTQGFVAYLQNEYDEGRLDVQVPWEGETR